MKTVLPSCRVMRLCAIVLLSLLMSSSLAAQPQKPRPVIALDCAAAEQHLPGACRALKNALRDVMPGAVQRVMADLSTVPARPGNLAMALRIEREARGLQARLEWRRGVQPMQTGAAILLDTATRPDPLIRQLLHQNPGPFQ